MLKGFLNRIMGSSAEDRIDSNSGQNNSLAASRARSNDASSVEPPKLVTVYDAYGRQVQISLQDWREKVLGPNLKKHWGNPAELYSMIHSALNDGLFEDVAEASARLLVIDDIPERAYSVRAVVLMKTQRWDQAEQVLREGMGKLGETGTLLTNLAKVFAERGDIAKQDATLWRAIELDPNMDSGLLWWLAIAQERGGKPAYLEALHKAAALPGSWLPQMWLAREALEQGNVAEAKALYQNVLSDGRFYPSALMMMSGDLGRNKQVPLIIELVAPVFEPGKHDIQAGFNLLQAYVELKEVAAGSALLNKLYALGISPYKQHLDYYSNEFSKLQALTAGERSVDESAIEIETLAFDRPLWMVGMNEPTWLFNSKPDDAEKVLLLPLSLTGRQGDRSAEQREDDAGRFSRAMALYLAEAVHYWTPFVATIYIPTVKSGGPVVFGQEHDAPALCERFAADYRYLITGTLVEASTSWSLTLKLWDCQSRTCVEQVSQSAPHQEAGVALLMAERPLLAKLGTTGASKPFDAFYLRPSNEAITPYLVALGQLLMLNIAAAQPEARKQFWGERNMLEWPLNMALHWSTVETPKLIYLACLSRAAKYGSDVLPEFKERSLRLLANAKQHSPGPFAKLEPLMWRVFGMQEELNQLIDQRGIERQDAHSKWLLALREP